MPRGRGHSSTRGLAIGWVGRGESRHPTPPKTIHTLAAPTQAQRDTRPRGNGRTTASATPLLQQLVEDGLFPSPATRCRRATTPQPAQQAIGTVT